jgi:hypothetical protein
LHGRQLAWCPTCCLCSSSQLRRVPVSGAVFVCPHSLLLAHVGALRLSALLPSTLGQGQGSVWSTTRQSICIAGWHDMTVCLISVSVSCKCKDLKAATFALERIWSTGVTVMHTTNTLSQRSQCSEHPPLSSLDKKRANTLPYCSKLRLLLPGVMCHRCAVGCDLVLRRW